MNHQNPNQTIIAMTSEGKNKETEVKSQLKDLLKMDQLEKVKEEWKFFFGESSEEDTSTSYG